MEVDVNVAYLNFADGNSKLERTVSKLAISKI